MILWLTACRSTASPSEAPFNNSATQISPPPILLPTVPPTTNKIQPYYSGWVYQPYPDLALAQMEADLHALKSGGANVVWAGHNNPGEVEAEMVEPGLSYAVYQEAQNPQSPHFETAVAIIRAQHRFLQAARKVDLPVVFAIGYHSQMGQTWNQDHPEALRRQASGEPLVIFAGNATASPYEATFRTDMMTYYQWVAEEFIRPYRDTILMINLADEPLGGDFSAAAEAVFQAQTGDTFAKASPAQIGKFQDQVIVDYAIWGAQQWQTLMPDLPVTFSFCGAQGRWSYHLPNVEALFRDTPPNFVPTFDAYLHDGPANEPLNEEEVGALLLFARSLGYYSELYGRDLWLWSAGNRWGLAGDSPNPGNIGDAVANGYLLATAVRSTGGRLRGLAVWHTNLRHQGLFGDDPASDPYKRELLFEKVNRALPNWRTIMASEPGQTRQLILLSDSWVHNWVGDQLEAVRTSPVSFAELLPLTRVETSQAVAGRLPSTLENIEAVIILDPIPDFLTASDLAGLRHLLAAGGQVVAMPSVTAVIGSAPSGLVELPALPWELSRDDWANLLPGTAVAQTGFHVSSPGQALYYQPGQVIVPLPPYRKWRTFNAQADPHSNTESVLGPHSFALAP